MSNRTYLFDKEIYDLSFNLHNFMNMELLEGFEIPCMVGKINCCIQILINSLSKIEKFLNHKQGRHHQKEDRKMMMGIYRNTLHYMVMIFKYSVTNPECKANKQIKVLRDKALKGAKVAKTELNILNILKSSPKAINNTLEKLNHVVVNYKSTSDSTYDSLAAVIGHHRMFLINIHAWIYDMMEAFIHLWKMPSEINNGDVGYMNISMGKLDLIITYYYKWLDKIIPIIEEAMEPLASDKIAHFNFKVK